MRRVVWFAVIVWGTVVGGAEVFARSAAAPRTEGPLPAGIILPVRLDNSISSRKAKAGQVITARVMQNVPLPDRGRVRAGTRVVGRIVSVGAPTSSSGAQVSLKFESLVVSGKTFPLNVSLRAIASPREVEDAQLPLWGSDRGTGPTAYTTVQIGGDVVYRGGGHVMHDGVVVGEPVYDGVLARVTTDSDGECRGTVDGNESLQALWVFSADACGAFGLPGLSIVHHGRTDPSGEIALAASHGQLDVRSGSGMLLRVNR